MPSRRFLLAVVVLAAVAALDAGAAAANRLSLSDKAFRITWTPMRNGIQTLPEVEPPDIVKVSCNTTMEGSFHSSTFVKVARSLVGNVSRVTIDRSSCRETGGGSGSFEFLTTGLPWHVTYSSFTGTLPRIGTIKLSFIGMGLRIVAGLHDCLSRSTTASPAGWILEREAGGVITSIIADSQTILPFPPTGIGCTGYSMLYEGLGRVTRLGTTTTVSLTLI